MNVSDLVFATSRPYSSLLRDIIILGKPYLSKQLAFDMQLQTQSNWC